MRREWLVRQRWLARQGWRLTRRSAGAITIVLLSAAFVVGVAGILVSVRTEYHLIVETVAVLAGMTGIYAERRAAVVEERRSAIRAVSDELKKNIKVLGETSRFAQNHSQPKPRMYPRLDVTAVEACLARGALSHHDPHRSRALSKWLDEAHAFNRGLHLTELLFYTLHFVDPQRGRNVVAKVDQELQGKLGNMLKEARDTTAQVQRSGSQAGA